MSDPQPVKPEDIVIGGRYTLNPPAGGGSFYRGKVLKVTSISGIKTERRIAGQVEGTSHCLNFSGKLFSWIGPPVAPAAPVAPVAAVCSCTHSFLQIGGCTCGAITRYKAPR